MPQRVVDALEVIQIEKKQRHLIAAPTGQTDRLREPLGEQDSLGSRHGPGARPGFARVVKDNHRAGHRQSLQRAGVPREHLHRPVQNELPTSKASAPRPPSPAQSVPGAHGSASPSPGYVQSPCRRSFNTRHWCRRRRRAGPRRRYRAAAHRSSPGSGLRCAARRPGPPCTRGDSPGSLAANGHPRDP